MKKVITVTAMALVLAFAFTRSASALSISLYDPNNSGIASGALFWSVNGHNIDLYEYWTETKPGFVLFDDLGVGDWYVVRAHMYNFTLTDWTSFNNELLDPAGDDNDSLDLQPYPSFVPGGFTTSNDYDNLRLASWLEGVPTTSTSFSSVIGAGFTPPDGRDFIEFSNGLVSGPGGYEEQMFSLYDFDRTNPHKQFLLAQRPNEHSVGPDPTVVPEPATMTLFGLGLLGSGLAARRSKRKSQANV